MNIAKEFGLDPEQFVWQHLALCQNIPTNAYFGDADKNPAIFNAVVDLCSACPVQEICRLKAEENGEYGINGGVKFERGKIVDE